MCWGSAYSSWYWGFVRRGSMVTMLSMRAMRGSRCSWWAKSYSRPTLSGLKIGSWALTTTSTGSIAPGPKLAFRRSKPWREGTLVGRVVQPADAVRAQDRLVGLDHHQHGIDSARPEAGLQAIEALARGHTGGQDGNIGRA